MRWKSIRSATLLLRSIKFGQNFSHCQNKMGFDFMVHSVSIQILQIHRTQENTQQVMLEKNYFSIFFMKALEFH